MPPPATLASFHREMAQYLVVNPAATNEEIAQAFGYSVSWVGIVRSSDLFKAHLNSLLGRLDETVIDGVKGRLEQLAQKSLDRLLQKIEVEDAHREIRDTAELALRGVGILTKNGSSVTINAGTNQAIFQTVDAATLAAARAKMLSREAQNAVEIPAEPAERTDQLG